MGDGPVSDARVLSVQGDSALARDDVLATEEPLEIRAEGGGEGPVRVAVTMRTPGHDAELALGFLFTEGLIRGAGDLMRPAVRELLPGTGQKNVISVRLRERFDEELVRRNFYATSSCGICGKASLEQVERLAPPLDVTQGPVVARSVLLALPAKLRAAQQVFARTGGLHATGLFTPGGELRVAREDVGRHNAMDKAIGRMLLDHALPLSDAVALVSGRASFELLQKAAVARVPVLCAVSAPSSLAVSAAEKLGVTLVGFLRGDAFNVYAHPSRIDLER